MKGTQGPELLAPPRSQTIAAALVSRIGADQLPGGAKLLAKRCREIGLGWIVWATGGTYPKAYKITAATESADGKAVYEERRVPRILLKGRSRDRRFVVCYVEKAPGSWGVSSAYLWTTRHRGNLDGRAIDFEGGPAWRACTVTELRAYVAGLD